MNMPLTKDGMVDFNATLFGLIRSSLNIKRPEGTTSNSTIYFFHVSQSVLLLRRIAIKDRERERVYQGEVRLPTPPLTQQQSTVNKLGLLLVRGGGGVVAHLLSY